MNKALHSNIALIICLLVVFTASTPAIAAGEGDTVYFGPVIIEGRHVVENKESLRDGSHTFVLTADGDAQMPEGSSGGVKKVSIRSNDAFSFGEIYYSKPGVYKYTVTREITKSENLKQDDSVYNCTVTVFNDGVTAVVFSKGDSKGKPDRIEYRDSFVSQQTSKVKTGDKSGILVWICLLSAAAALLLMIKKTRK